MNILKKIISLALSAILVCQIGAAPLLAEDIIPNNGDEIVTSQTTSPEQTQSGDTQTTSPEQTQTDGTQTTLPEQTQTNGTQTTLPEQTQSEETPSIMAPPVEINTIDGFNYVNPYQVYPIPFNQLYSVNSQYQQFQDTGKYYYILSDEEKAIYDSLETKIATTAVGAEIESNTFSITGDPEIMATNICTAFMMDYPELFWLQEYLYYMPLTNYSISLGTYSNVDPYPFVPYDSLIGASIEADNNAIQAKVSEILSGTTGMTNYEKVCHFNSWLTKNNKYNPIVANSDTISSATHPKGKIPWTIQSAFLSETNKVADNLADAAPVCEAYSEAMKVLCDKVGIPCILATGNVHQWNYVQLDGEWYGVDSTWNDPPFAAGSDNNLVTDYLDSNNNPLVPVSPNDTILNKDCDGTTEYLLKGTTNFEYIDPDSTQNEHIREDESKNLVLIDTDYSSLPAQPITVDQTYKEIYANGLPITIEAGTATNTTKIKYNDGTDKYVVLSGSDITEVDLIDYIIYGGSKDNSVESTSIAMTGGSVGGIYGGGQETTATVTGNTSITISTGAEVYGDVYGGGFKGTVTGTTNVIIDGGKIFSYVYQNSVYGGDVYGGGQETTATVGNGTNIIVNANSRIDGSIIGDGSTSLTVTGNTNLTMDGGTVSGSIVVNNVTINSEKNLTVNTDKSLTVSGTLTNNGTIIINGGTIDGTGTLAGTGKIVVQYSATDIPDITEQLYTGKALTPIADNTYTAKKTILDKEISTVFTVTYSPAIVKDVGDYKATLTNTDDNKNVITKTFSVVKVGTDFTGGVTVSKNNPTYGEDITISVTPTIGSKKAGLMLANMDAQTANTVALYLKNADSTYTLISEEKAVTSGTQVDFTVKTTDKKLKIGANTVVVKYKGTANMADQSAEVIITVTAKQLTWNNGAVNDKIYDGNANATVKTAPTLVGVLQGDNVSVKVGTVNFATSTAGTNIKVTATGYGIEGADIGYYIAPTTQPTFANANITKSIPTIEVKNTFTDKTFDAKAIALTAEQITVTGASYSDVKYNYYADNGGTKGGKLDSAPINAGTYWVEAYVEANASRDAATSTAVKFTINKLVPTFEVTPSADSQIGGKTVDITVTVTNLPVGATAIPASNIVIAPTNATLKTALQPVSGKTNEYKATYTLSEYTSDGVNAKFDVTSTENGNYAAQSTAVSKQVSILDKYTTTVTLKVNGSTANTSITYGQDVVLTAEITSNGTLPAGTVTFAGETPVNVVDGKATLTIKKLSANKTYNAIFTPTNNDYKGSTSSDITVTVNKADLAGVLSISGTPAYNETLTADTSKLTGVTGDTLNFTYQWLRDKSEIVGKTNSTYTVTADDIGKAITVKVSAGTNYKESVSEAIIIVKAQPKYVVPTDLTVRYGNELSAITFVKVNGDATHTAGTFSWMDSTLSVGNVGTKTFKAKFTPDDATMYETKTDIDIQVVVEKAAAPTITFPTSNGPITYGSALSTLTLTGGNTEYGTFTWDNANLIPTVSTKTATVKFTPNQLTTVNYETIDNLTQAISITVNKSTPIVNITIESITGDGNNKTVKLKAEVNKVGLGKVPTGNITFTNSNSIDMPNNEVALVNGVATYEWTALAEQEYSVTASYNGNDNYDNADKLYTFDLSKKSQVDFKITPIEKKTYGDSSFTLSSTGGSGAGTVTYQSSDETIIKINGTSATILKAGTVTITATKAGDSQYNNAISTTEVIVGRKVLLVKAKNIEIYDTSEKPILDPLNDVEYIGFVNEADKAEFIKLVSISYSNGSAIESCYIRLSILSAGNGKYLSSLSDGKLTVLESQKFEPKPVVETVNNQLSIGIPVGTIIKDVNDNILQIDKTQLVIYDEVSTDDKTNISVQIEKVTDKAKKEILNANSQFLEISLVDIATYKPVKINGKIDLFIPYSAGANSKCDFVVMHFLSANNVEYPSFVKLTNGLKVTTNSLSPFVIAWKDARVITPPVVTPDYPVYYPTWYPMYNYTPKYTIKFNSLGGTDVTPIVFENSVKLDIAKLVPTKNGYVFGGWYLDAGLKNRVLSSDIINNDTILYARWLPLAVSQDITTIQQEVEVPQTGDSWIKNILKSLIA